MKSLRPLLALLFLLAPALHAQEKAPPPSPSPLETKYREGLYAEEAKQDLAAAAKAYQEIVAGFDRDRETASSALFRLGEVYRKQNRPKEAAAAFRRVALEFPDRDPLARLARENLAALGEPLPMVPGAAVSPGQDPEEEKVLARLLQLEKDSPDLILKPDLGLQKNGYISCDEAAEAGYVRVVQWFLDHKASVDVTPSGGSPLSMAAALGRAPMVAFLLEKGANIAGTGERAQGSVTTDEVIRRADYPLRMAAVNGHLAIVRLLVEKGADVNGRRKEQNLENGEKRTFYRYVPLTAAAEAGHRTIVDYLLSQKADPNAGEGEALLLAVENGCTEVVASLLAGGAVPDQARLSGPHGIFAGDPPLHRTRSPITPGPPRSEFLSRVPGSYRGYPLARKEPLSTLERAVLFGTPEMVSLLLKHGAAVDGKPAEQGSTALTLALVAGEPEMVKLLVAAKADVNHVAPGGVRLIHIPILRKDQEMYELLRSAGAEVKGTSPDGNSALQALDRRQLFSDPDKYLSWAERLLNEGVDPDGDAKFRPVNLAAEAGNLEFIKLLKAKGADFTPDQADAPLPLVLLNGFEARHLAVIKALIEAGADQTAVSTNPEPGSGSSDPEVRPTYVVESMDLLQAAASWVPEAALMEELLTLQPKGGKAWPFVISEYEKARKNLAVEAAKVAPAAGNDSTSRSPFDQLRSRAAASPEDYSDFHSTKEAQERVVKTAPALIRRLWDYHWQDRNELRTRRVWFQMLSDEAGEYHRKFVWGRDIHHELLAAPAFVPASPTPEPVNLVEALVYVYGAGLSVEDVRWDRPVVAPDLRKLTILRSDPATGKTVRREAVDLAALMQKDDPAALPVLQPGDVIEAFFDPNIAGTDPDWRSFPDPASAFFSRVLTPRAVTVKAGDWQREFQLKPWMPAFRWDPADDKLAIVPLLSQIIRYLPKPLYFYRMNAVRFTPKGGETQTLDVSGPLPPEKDRTLHHGDRLEFEALPADDPVLVKRLQQGLFVSREEHGFLREVFHHPGTPALEWNEDLMTQVMLQFTSSSESLLPFIVTKDMAVRRLTPGTAAWGGCVELPSAKEHGSGWSPSSANERAGRFVFTDGRQTQTQDFWYQGMRFRTSESGWKDETEGKNRLTSRTLAELVRAVTAGNTTGWGRWELRRKDIAGPLCAFVPGQDPIPFVLLQEEDTIHLTTEDAAKAQPPAFRGGSSGNGYSWHHVDQGILKPPQTVIGPQQGIQMQQQMNANPPQRRRVTLPTQNR